jgi:hypothetical protein
MPCLLCSGVDRATKMDVAMNGDSAPHPSQTNDMSAMNSKIKEGKIGHRRVDAGGLVTYKKVGRFVQLLHNLLVTQRL